MRLGFAKSPTFLIALVVIGFFCAVEHSRFAGLQRLEWMTYDWRTRLAYRYPLSTTATNLGLVEISDDTIAAVNNGSLGFRYGLYWPREVYGRALGELEREGAKAVGFDVLFAERRTDHPDVTLGSGETLSSDAFFARQIKKGGNVILAADHDVMPAAIFRTNAWKVGSISQELDSDGVLRRTRPYQIFRIWHRFILQVAAQFNLDLSRTVVSPGKITFQRKDGSAMPFPTDKEGRIATALLSNPVPKGLPESFAPFTDYRAWTLGIVLAARELKLDLDHPEFTPEGIVLHGPNGLVRRIPIDRDGYFYIDWAITEKDPHLTTGAFEDVLYSILASANGERVPDRWTNKLVIIGSTATGNDLTDLGSTPLESETHLVLKHFNVANSIITDRFIREMPEWVKLLLIIGVGIFAAWVTWAVPKPAYGSLLMGLFTVSYLAGAVALFIAYRVWIPIVVPVVCAGFVTHLSVLTYRVRFEQSEKRLMKQLFSRVVAPEVVNEIVNSKSLSMGGRREITVYFADVRGFTELSDLSQTQAMEYIQANKLTPEEAENYIDSQAREILSTVTAYLGTIADIVKEHRGLLDKYIGDCVMSFWGAPLPNSRHAVDAVQAAIAAQRALAALNHQRRLQNEKLATDNEARAARGEPPLPLLPLLSMGSGINSGTAIVGFMGSESQMNYTAFGREVNLASRLESISGHGRILIGELTYLALQRDAPELAKLCIEWPPRQVKGFRDLVKVFEVLWQSNAIPDAPEDDSDIRSTKPAVA